MKLELIRNASSRTCTIGELFIDGEHECYTLEDIVREQDGVPVELWKIKGQTAIPAGTYVVTLTMSARFGRVMPLLNNVDGFAGIRMHPGNTDADTEGCILLGLQIADDQESILQSRIAFEHVLKRLYAADERGEEITISVVNG